MSIEVNGVTIETDEEGYLVNLSDWSEDVAKEIAKGENVDMSENHWEAAQATASPTSSQRRRRRFGAARSASQSTCARIAAM